MKDVCGAAIFLAVLGLCLPLVLAADLLVFCGRYVRLACEWLVDRTIFALDVY